MANVVHQRPKFGRSGVADHEEVGHEQECGYTPPVLMRGIEEKERCAKEHGALEPKEKPWSAHYVHLVSPSLTVLA